VEARSGQQDSLHRLGSQVTANPGSRLTLHNDCLSVTFVFALSSGNPRISRGGPVRTREVEQRPDGEIVLIGRSAFRC
jgi:hypothetical protein